MTSHEAFCEIVSLVIKPHPNPTPPHPCPQLFILVVFQCVYGVGMSAELLSSCMHVLFECCLRIRYADYLTTDHGI